MSKTCFWFLEVIAFILFIGGYILLKSRKPKIWPNGLCPTCGKKIGEDFTSIKKVFEGTTK